MGLVAGSSCRQPNGCILHQDSSALEEGGLVICLSFPIRSRGTKPLQEPTGAGWELPGSAALPHWGPCHCPMVPSGPTLWGATAWPPPRSLALPVSFLAGAWVRPGERRGFLFSLCTEQKGGGGGTRPFNLFLKEF